MNESLIGLCSNELKVEPEIALENLLERKISDFAQQPARYHSAPLREPRPLADAVQIDDVAQIEEQKQAVEIEVAAVDDDDLAEEEELEFRIIDWGEDELNESGAGELGRQAHL